MTAILRAAELLSSWSEQVDDTHAKPGTVDAMRALSIELRVEHKRLASSPGAALEALIKAWATRELAALPVGLQREWVRSGVIPPELQYRFTGLPEPVAALVGAHLADGLGICECCRRYAPCRLLSDGSDSGERDWRCAWGCPAVPPGEDPVARWARTAGL